MKKIRSALGQAGFTLIEILVTLILISLLVAAVFPVVVQQVGQADAPRLANDLVNVRSGIELFGANLRNRLPNGLDELVNLADVTGNDIGGRAYGSNHTSRWNGPYIDAPIPVGGGTITSGYDAVIQNTFTRFSSTSNAESGGGDFVAIVVAGLANDFDSLNDLIDGESETSTSSAGKLRLLTSTAYYLAVPFQ